MAVLTEVKRQYLNINTVWYWAFKKDSSLKKLFSKSNYLLSFQDDQPLIGVLRATWPTHSRDMSVWTIIWPQMQIYLVYDRKLLWGLLCIKMFCKYTHLASVCEINCETVSRSYEPCLDFEYFLSWYVAFITSMAQSLI